MLNQLFPLTRSARKDVTSLVIAIAVYVVVSAAVSLVVGFLTWIPVVGLVLSLIRWLVGLYCAAGIVLAVLAYFKILK